MKLTGFYLFFISCVLPNSFGLCTIYAESGNTDIQNSTYPQDYLIYPLCIVHPAEGSQLPYVRTSFVYGSADPRGKLTVNDKIVPVHPGGGFLTMVNYSTGPCIINAQLQLSTMTFSITRKVFVQPPPQTSPAEPLTIEYVKPDLAMELRTGDTVTVKSKGSPNAKGYFTISGVKRQFPLKEIDSTIKGIYCGSYIVQAKDNLNNSRISVTFENEKKKVSRTSPGRLFRMREDVHRIVEVISSTAVVRAGPAISHYNKAGYMLLISTGIRLEVIGRIGNEFKIRLSGTRTGWISQNEVRLLPERTLPAQSYIHSINTVHKYPDTQIKVFLDQKIPFEIVSSDDSQWIDVSFFGAISNTDWINYDSSARTVDLIQWFQDNTDTFRLHIQLKQNSWWGYETRYEGNTFILELRSPPYRDRVSPVFKDITVAIDAGHSPDNGAIGPTGLLEKDVNMAIALSLEKKLLAEKGNVVMIRRENESPGLYERSLIARRAKADILISIHNNSLPEGQNPFERNGYGVYYFYPQSFSLSKEIHKSYGEVFKNHKISLRDDGLHYGNLVLTRTYQMPTVLTESAYMILPEQESLLKTKEFQSACAEAILTGLKRYISHMRPTE